MASEFDSVRILWRMRGGRKKKKNIKYDEGTKEFYETVWAVLTLSELFVAEEINNSSRSIICPEFW